MMTVFFAVFGAAALIGGVMGLYEAARVRLGTRVIAEVVAVDYPLGSGGGSPQAGATHPTPRVTVSWTDRKGPHTASLAAPGRRTVGDQLDVILVGSKPLPAYARTKAPYGGSLMLLAGGAVLMLLAFAT